MMADRMGGAYDMSVRDKHTQKTLVEKNYQKLPLGMR